MKSKSKSNSSHFTIYRLDQDSFMGLKPKRVSRLRVKCYTNGRSFSRGSGRVLMARPFPGPSFGILCNSCYTFNSLERKYCKKCRKRLG